MIIYQTLLPKLKIIILQSNLSFIVLEEVATVVTKYGQIGQE